MKKKKPRTSLGAIVSGCGCNDDCAADERPGLVVFNAKRSNRRPWTQIDNKKNPNLNVRNTNRDQIMRTTHVGSNFRRCTMKSCGHKQDDTKEISQNWIMGFRAIIHRCAGKLWFVSAHRCVQQENTSKNSFVDSSKQTMNPISVPLNKQCWRFSERDICQ